MLTASDGRTDGKFKNYLNDSGFRSFDPPLFDSLHPCLTDPAKRTVAIAESADIIPNAKYYPPILTDNMADRARYFAEFAAVSSDCELLFFDPDNGLEVGSVGKGRKDSCKYVYWDELRQAYADGKSLLVYQHFCRVKRDLFTRDLADRARIELGASDTIAFRTPNVLFLLIPQLRNMEIFKHQADIVANVWGSQIQVQAV